MREAGINEAHVMCITGNRVLIIFDSVEAQDRILSAGVMSTWFERVKNWKASYGMEQCRGDTFCSYRLTMETEEETFERIATIGGSVICVVEETLEPASFERGHVLIESSSLARVEFKIDLKVLDEVFPVRVSEAELFLRGPRVSRSVQEDQSDGSTSEREDTMANSAASDAGKV
ncbi:hypothetical protein V6N13_110687 [Hibiscus sabdariffa]